MDYRELKIDSKPIGTGNFSVCYKGYLHGTPVAIKVSHVKHVKKFIDHSQTLNITKITEGVIQSFNHEVGLMSDIKHVSLFLEFVM